MNRLGPLVIVCCLTLVACAEMPDLEVTRDTSRDLQDSDRDGVINYRDRCPGTAEDNRTDNSGCALTDGEGKPLKKWDMYAPR